MGLARALEELTPKQRIYVESVLSGMSKTASIVAAGYADPARASYDLNRNDLVQRALKAGYQETARKVKFQREDAHEMYMDAFRNAESANEQIQAVNALVKLHGLAEPERIRHEHEHKHSGEVDMKMLPTDELLKLAGLEEDHFVIEGELAEKPALLEAPDES